MLSFTLWDIRSNTTMLYPLDNLNRLIDFIQYALYWILGLQLDNPIMIGISIIECAIFPYECN